jgi:coenzyme F420-reducing hydrogenase alpha subunit
MTDESEKKYKVKIGTKTQVIQVDYLARVEGEGSFFVKIKDGKVEEVQLKIFEPPRFFEALLRGRELFDAPDITARICGICPVAYQTSAVQAMENALQIDIPDYLSDLRRLIYCGEWIESHALHIFMLHAPDFLGYPDAIQMAKKYPDVVQMGLRIKKTGNRLIEILGGREVHPVNLRVGGFYRLPEKKELLALVDSLKQARDDALTTVELVNTFSFPHLERKYECVSLVHPKEYPIARGQIGSSSGLRIPVEDYEKHFEERHIERSTALQGRMKNGGIYVTGPIARYNLNHQTFSPMVKNAIKKIGFEPQCHNPFRSIIVRALELLYACDEALRLIEAYDSEKEPAFVAIPKKAAIGYGASEAPRGLLFHRYKINAKGVIEDAKIVPPTAQNQKIIEEDLFELASKNMDLSDEDLTWKCEQAIRNYDPCISCSTHFLKLQRQHE